MNVHCTMERRPVVTSRMKLSWSRSTPFRPHITGEEMREREVERERERERKVYELTLDRGGEKDEEEQ